MKFFKILKTPGTALYLGSLLRTHGAYKSLINNCQDKLGEKNKIQDYIK